MEDGEFKIELTFEWMKVVLRGIGEAKSKGGSDQLVEGKRLHRC